jgi:hypothetical protein
MPHDQEPTFSLGGRNLKSIFESILSFFGGVFAVSVIGYLLWQTAVGASLVHQWVWVAIAVLVAGTSIVAWKSKSLKVLAIGPLFALPLFLFGGLQLRDGMSSVFEPPAPAPSASAAALREVRDKLNGFLFGK